MHSMAPPLIYVWVGSALPDWATAALRLTRRYLGERQIILILDAHSQTTQALNDCGVEIWLRPSGRSNKAFDFLDGGFRSGFWRYTSERLCCLVEFCEASNVEKFFHAELDNIVFRLDGIDSILDSVGRGIFVPRDNVERAIGSLIYTNRVDSIREILLSYRSESPPANDMLALGNYLNTSPHGYALPTDAALSHSKPGWSFIDSKQLGGIFDAAAIGQYLLGVDPRNKPYRPLRNLFKNENNLFDFSELKFRADEKGLFVRRGPDVEHPVFNLHVHSKAIAKAEALLSNGSLMQTINAGQSSFIAGAHKVVTGPFLKQFHRIKRALGKISAS